MIKWFRKRYWLLAATAALVVGCLTTGCSLGYYSQAVGGHLSLMKARQPIADVLASEDTDPELKAKLQTLLDARVFAYEVLGLPENDSYSTYSETGRDAVTWNVVAVPEFSMQPKVWCFPVAGCVSYRGYFDRADAERYAKQLSEEGFDVTIGGASAYSTLGWFDDPVLDTMLRGNDSQYVSTLFHELAHQVLYIQDDSSFNEAFASFVEQEGFRIWLRDRGEAERIDAYNTSLERIQAFSELLNTTRTNLIAAFEEPLDDVEARRVLKASVFADMQNQYQALKESWGGYSGYDRWFARDLNNAHLLGVSTYRRLIPAFEGLYRESGSDLVQFYKKAEELSALDPVQRNARLAQLAVEKP
jgi:predicted aminopeptidase